VPDLVFAGKLGWLTADLVQQLENCDWLDGRIRFVPSPSDAELAGLYRGCLFTVFPSLYEGWGLPVSESLRFGKMVAASDRASIPEAGGNFCAYYDPENVAAAYEVIRGLIDHPERVAAMEARIAASYRPPSWADTAAALLNALLPAAPAIAEPPAPVEYPVNAD
jgi:glycosyltransferase involved in cell wall biosynthesis